MRFCHSNHLDKSTEMRVKDLFKYLNGPLLHSVEQSDFSLLSRSLRSEMVLKKSLGQLQRLSLLDPVLFDAVSYSHNEVYAFGM